MSIVVARTCTTERKIVSYELVYKCDKCGEGEVNYMEKAHCGKMLHKCDKCGEEYWFSSKYPKVTYISLD